MALLSASTTFTVVGATAAVTTADLIVLPENAGENVRRELHYPGDVLPPLVYARNPDTWTWFDTTNLAASTLVTAKTLGGNKLGRWAGHAADNAVIETWRGDARVLSMTADFLRRLLEYYLNPPLSGHITWYPKDRTTAVYAVEIESITVDGAPVVKLDYLATKQGYVVGEVSLALRIVSEVV